MANSPDKPRPMGNDGNIFRCPMCGTHLAHMNVPTFPFCSDRCRLLDLSNWMDGKYAVSRPLDPSDDQEEIRRPLAPPESPEKG